MIGRAVEYIAVLLVIVFIVTQILIPALTRKRLFPMFIKRHVDAVKKTEAFNQQVETENVEERLKRRRRQHYAAKSKQKAKEKESAKF